MKKVFISILALVLALGLALPMATPVRAADYYVNPGGDIQAAVDGASSGDTIILNDGTYPNYATVTVGTSGITIKAANPGLAILDEGGGPAFRLVDGLSDVTFEGLVIQNRTGSRGGGIEAWDMSTSNIKVRNNQFLDNVYNGILVGSEGGYIHTNWAVHRNVAIGNGFAGIELTNSSGSSINRNEVSGSLIGIVVQARNTRPDSGLIVIEGINLNNNKVDGSSYGIYVLGLASQPTPPFDPIDAAQAELRDVTLVGNQFTGTETGYGALVWGFLDGKVTNPSLVRNSFTDFDLGIGLYDDVVNAKLVRNTFDNCTTEIYDGGEDTKTPPGPF